jgi:peroxiredoxin
MPAPGHPAPEFVLRINPDESVALRQFRGRPLILAFYPADWSPVCSDQMALYQAVKTEFDRYDAALLGVSVDGVWCHRAFAESRNLGFPLLADFQPKGEVSAAYGSFDDRSGESERNLFVMDPDGTVFWNYHSPIGVNPGADGILAALDAMQTKA